MSPEHKTSPEFIQANKEIPPTWYEGRTSSFILSALTAGAVIYGMRISGIPSASLHIEDFHNLALPVTSALTYLTSALLDTHSTKQTLKLVDKADTLGIKHGVYEANPFLSKKPNQNELLGWSLKTVLEGTTLAASVFIPPLGFTSAIGKGIFAPLNNFRVKRRLERAIQITEAKLVRTSDGS